MCLRHGVVTDASILLAGYPLLVVGAKTTVVPMALVIFALGGMCSSTFAGGIYKWVDENAKVHYGDRPPQVGKGTELELKPQPPTEAATKARPIIGDSESWLSKQRKLLDVMEQDRKERAQGREKKAADTRKRIDLKKSAPRPGRLWNNTALHATCM